MSDDTPTDAAPSEGPTGLPEVTYRSHAKAARDMIFGVIFLLLGWILALCVLGANDASAGSLAALLLACLGPLLVGVGGLARSLIFRTRVTLYENGVLVERVWSKTFTRWEDVEAILEFDPPSERNVLGMEVNKYCCGFSRVDGATFWFHINRMSGLRDFSVRLHRRIDDRVRANALRALAAGEVVWFGYIGIGSDGLHSNKGVLPWAEVSFAGCVRDTEFEVLKKGSNWSWFSKKISEVENVAILEELIKSRKEWAGSPTEL
jgi:hypothetical protein